MTSVVSLPKTPSQLPGNLSTSELLTETDVSLRHAQKSLYRISKPTVIAGSIETHLNWWLAAQIVFPDVEKLLFQADGHWLKITPTDTQKIRNEASQDNSDTAGNQQTELAAENIVAHPNKEPASESVKAELEPASSKKTLLHFQHLVQLIEHVWGLAICKTPPEQCVEQAALGRFVEIKNLAELFAILTVAGDFQCTVVFAAIGAQGYPGTTDHHGIFQLQAAFNWSSGSIMAFLQCWQLRAAMSFSLPQWGGTA